MRKTGSFVNLLCLRLELLSLKCQKCLIFYIFCRWQQKNNYSLGIICKCIWKVLFISFRKCYELLGSDLLLARCQPLKMYNFGIFLWNQQFFYISTLSSSRTVTLKHIKYTIFCKNSNKIFQLHLNVLPKLWLTFCCHQQRIQKMSHLRHFNDHNSGG